MPDGSRMRIPFRFDTGPSRIYAPLTDDGARLARNAVAHLRARLCFENATVGPDRVLERGFVTYVETCVDIEKNPNYLYDADTSNLAVIMYS